MAHDVRPARPARALRRGASLAWALATSACCGGPERDAGATSGGERPSAYADVRCEDDASPVGRPPEAPLGPATVRFTSTAVAPGPVGLTYAVAVWTGREHLLFGGATPSTPAPAGTRAAGGHGAWVESPPGAPWSSIGWALDPVLGTWRALPGNAPPGSTGTDAVAWHCGRAFILTASGAGYRYDPTTGDTRATSTVGAPEHCSGQRRTR